MSTTPCMQTTSVRERNFVRIAGRGLVVFAALLLLANSLRTTSPLVVVDEYAYLMGGIELNRAQKMRELMPTVPQFGNFLFLREIYLLSSLKVPVDISAKLLNVVYFALSAAILSALILACVGGKRALLLIAVICFYPLGSYSAYIMPECVYLLVFVILYYFIVKRSGSIYVTWILASLLIAFLTLVKPHGLFVFGAFQIATCFWCFVAAAKPFRRALQLCFLSTAVYAFTLWASNSLLAPASATKAGDVVGTFYWGMLLSSVPTWDRFVATLHMMAILLAAIIFLLAPSISFVSAVVLSKVRANGVKKLDDLLLFSALFLLTLVVLIVVISSYIIVAYETDRIHLRYVSFIFPPLLTLSWIMSAREASADTIVFRCVTAAVWLLAGIFLLYRLPSIRLLPIDAPELFFAYSGQLFGSYGFELLMPYLVPAVAIGAPLLFVFLRNARWFDVQAAVLLLLLVFANWNTYSWITHWSNLHAPFRSVGDVARIVCGGKEDEMIAVGTEGNFISLYHSLAGVGRAVPLRILKTVDEAKKEIAATGTGRCVLTTVQLDTGRLLMKAGSVNLIRMDEGRM